MTTTSKEYAQALFELSAAENGTEETLAGLDLVRGLMAESPEYRAMLASPAIPREERVRALESALRGRIPDILLGVLRMMISRGHIGALNDMARFYEELAREYRGEAVATVTSAIALDAEELETLRAGLEKKFNRKVTLRCAVDPALIGGMRVEIEGRVIDGSIRNKLDKIKEVMHS